VDEVTGRHLLQVESDNALGRLRSLTDDFDGVVAASLEANADDEHDPEGPTIAYERSRLAALRAETVTYLEGIGRAMGRVEDGTYESCARCGGPIGRERLEARPTTDLCITCARHT
jgi:DnaK suppressor protein